MKKLLCLSILVLSLLSPPVRAANIPLVTGPQDVPSLQSYLNNLINQINNGAVQVTSNTIWSAITTASGLCTAVIGGDPCTLFFGYADPRGYGGNCDNQGNNNFHDDGPAFTDASKNSYNLPVLNPGHCKIASTVTSTKQNQVKIFSFPFEPAYDSNQQRTGLTYIFVPNGTSPAQYYVFDQSGYGGSSFFNIQLSGNFNQGGMSGWGNSYSSQIRSGTNFNAYEHVACGNMAACIGTLADASGNVVGTTQNFIIQQVGHDIKFSNLFYGEFNNFGDTFFNQVDSNGMQGPAFSTIDGFSSGIFISDWRAESGGGNITRKNGAAMYWNATAPLQITTFYCDRNPGPCIDVGPQGANVTVSNMGGSGGAQQTSPYNADIVVEGQRGATGLNTKYVDIENFQASSFQAGAYVLSTVDTPDYITLHLSHGDAGSAYNTALFNFANPVVHFLYSGVGSPEINGGTSAGDNVGIGTTAPLGRLAVVGLGTTAPIGTTTGALAVCIDSAGNFYAKASCP